MAENTQEAASLTAPDRVPGDPVYKSGQKAALSQDELNKFKGKRLIYLMPLNETGKGTNFRHKSLPEPIPAGVLAYFSDALATELAKNPVKMNLQIDYPKEQVQAVSKWMKKGGGPWSHKGPFCRRLEKQEDLRLFRDLVKEWKIDYLMQIAEQDLEVAKQHPDRSKRSEAANDGPKPQPGSQTRNTNPRKANINTNKACHGCGSKDHLWAICPQRRCFRCGQLGHADNSCTHSSKFTVGGIFVKDEFGCTSLVPSDSLKTNCIKSGSGGERTYEISGTLIVYESKLARSRQAQNWFTKS